MPQWYQLGQCFSASTRPGLGAKIKASVLELGKRGRWFCHHRHHWTPSLSLPSLYVKCIIRNSLRDHKSFLAETQGSCTAKVYPPLCKQTLLALAAALIHLVIWLIKLNSHSIGTLLRKLHWTHYWSYPGCVHNIHSATHSAAHSLPLGWSDTKKKKLWNHLAAIRSRILQPSLPALRGYILLRSCRVFSTPLS